MFQDSLTKKIAEAAAKIKTEPEVINVNEKSVEGAVEKIMNEKLIGNQHQIDANKNNKVDAHDFKLLRARKEKEKANSMKHGKEVKEEIEEIDEATPTAQQVKQGIGIARDKRYAKGNVTGAVKAMDKVNKGIAQHPAVNKELRKQNEEIELTESHFKVGDKVKCKTSGMEGEVVKMDKEDGNEDDKYYTVKREDGTMKKMAPEDMTKINEATKEQEGKFHSKLDKLVHKTFGKSKEEMKEESLDEAMWPGTPEYKAKYGTDKEKHEAKYGKGGEKIEKYGYRGKEAEHGETDWSKETKKEPKKKYGARQNYVRSRKISGKQLKDSFTGLLDIYREGGLKSIKEMFIKEEPDNEQFTKEADDVKRKATQKKSPEDEARVAKASVQAVKQEETEIQVINADVANGVEMVDIAEREMTGAEMKKREEIVMSMKKKMPGFKERYGDRAKEVVYATATKMAKKD
jgi:hypothetical protein